MKRYLTISLQKKLLISFVGISLFLSMLLSFTLYVFSYNLFFKNFKEHKVSTLNLVATLLKGDEHQTFNERQSMETGSYKKFQKILSEFYKLDNQKQYLYTLNYNRVTETLSYAIDSVMNREDIIWIENDKFSFQVTFDERGKVFIKYNFINYIKDFEFADKSNHKNQIQFVEFEKVHQILINGKLILEIDSNKKNQINVQNMILTRKSNYIFVSIPYSTGFLKTRVSLTLQGEPGSIAGGVLLEDGKYLQKLRDIINQKSRQSGIGEDFEKSSYGDFLVGYATIQNSQDENIGLVMLEINSQDIILFKKQFAYVSLSISFICFILTSMLGFIIAKHITKPLEILIKAVDEISSGNLIPIANINSKDEFGTLSTKFNTMTDNLRISYEVQFNLITEISEMNNNLEKKVVERTKLIQLQKQAIEKEIIMAKKIQNSLLPDEIPNIDGVKISFRFQPMMGVGGDLLDFDFRKDNILYLFICDVSGHGVSAALLATMVKMTIAECYEKDLLPSECIHKISNALRGKLSGHFISAIICKIDLVTGKIISANAGHLPMFRISKNNFWEAIQSKGRIISDILPSNVEDHISYLEFGDKIILYTDGITEATNLENEMFGDERLISLLKEFYNLSPSKLCDKVFETLLEFTNSAGAFEDDLTILIFEYEKNIV